MVAVLFAQGISFGFDHYVYVENAQHLVNGTCSIQQIVEDNSGHGFVSHGHSIIYIFINTAIIYACEFMGLFDPQSKMFIMRLLCGLMSMLTIYYCYRITYRLANRKAALAIGILTSMLWFMPYICVKTLPENVASVLLLAAVYRLAKTRKRTYKFSDDIFTGFLLGMSVSFCYNLIFLIIGAAISYTIKSEIKRGLLMIFGALISMLALEGLVDTIALNSPFYVLSEYIQNIISGSNATTGPKSVYMYISILAMVIPLPWGLAALFGYVKSWRHCFILFFPTTFYLVVSYLLPYKEEKFMLSILPIFLILCVSGWFRYQAESRFWSTRPRLRKWIIVLFFAANMPMLLLASTAYTRKPQMESMIYLSKYRSDITSILVDDSGNSESKSLPQYYLGKDVEIYILNKQDSAPDRSIYYSSVQSYENSHERNIFTERYFLNPTLRDLPQYVIFYGDYDMPMRLARMREVFPQLTYETSFSTSLADIIIEMVNPKNNNMNLHVYRTAQ